MTKASGVKWNLSRRRFITRGPSCPPGELLRRSRPGLVERHAHSCSCRWAGRSASFGRSRSMCQMCQALKFGAECADAQERTPSASMMTRRVRELAGCSHHTVQRYVARRAAGGELDETAARPQLIDAYLAKVEEWVERSHGKVRADVTGHPARSLAKGDVASYVVATRT